MLIRRWCGKSSASARKIHIFGLMQQNHGHIADDSSSLRAKSAHSAVEMTAGGLSVYLLQYIAQFGAVVELSASDISALMLSLRVAAVATVCSLPFALAVAYALARGRFWGKSLLNILVHIPLVLPPVVTGYGLLLLFGRHGLWGAWLDTCCSIVLSFRWTGAALAAAVMSFPLSVRAIRLSIEGVDQRLEEAAASLGAGPVACFVLVTLPLVLPGLCAGALLGFAKALGEFGATITFVGNIPDETRTLASALYIYTQSPSGDAGAIRLTLVALALSILALSLSEWAARRVDHHKGLP
jgi:molybdate transport system permease protein